MKNNLIEKQVFKLVKKEYITPYLIRATLHSNDISAYKICKLGVNNKIFIPPNGVDKVHLPELNLETKQWEQPAEELRPFVRTYTHRGIDLDKNHMIIDFVNHGDNGPASRWAINSKEGDELGIAMKLFDTPLYPESDWYFFVADATAIPVISCILEDLPEQAKGIAIIEKPTNENDLELIKPKNFEIIWLTNEHPELGSELSQKVRSITIPNVCTKFAYVAAEFSTVKDLRNYFRKELDWTKEELYAFSYWKAGSSEDKSVEDRHDENKSIE